MTRPHTPNLDNLLRIVAAQLGEVPEVKELLKLSHLEIERMYAAMEGK